MELLLPPRTPRHKMPEELPSKLASSRWQGGVGCHPSLPGPCGCREQLTVAGDSCPVPPGARPRTPPRRQLSGAPAPAPRSTAMRCHGLLFALCALAGKECPPRGEAWGGTRSPPPLPLGVCHPWVYSSMHHPTRVSPCWQPAVPASCPGEVPGASGLGDVGGTYTPLLARWDADTHRQACTATCAHPQ